MHQKSHRASFINGAKLICFYTSQLRTCQLLLGLTGAIFDSLYTPVQEVVWTSMGAQIIKHINWDDLATSGWKHLFPKQSNFKKFEEIWRFILLIRSLFRRWAGRQNLKAVVWVTVKFTGIAELDLSFQLTMIWCELKFMASSQRDKNPSIGRKEY